MLRKNIRLNLKKDFRWVASGKKIETKLVKLFIKNGDNSTARIGIAVSTSLFKKATDRNRAKRILSAAFEKLYQRLPENINIIALPKRGYLDVKSDDLTLELETALKKEGLLS